MKKLFCAVLAAALLSGLAACAPSGTQKQTITIGSKDFTEAILVSEIYAQALENAGYQVERKQALGGTPIIQEAMLKGDLNLYCEYTNTALVNVLKQAPEFDAQKAYDAVSKGYQEQFGFKLLEKSPGSNSQGLGIVRKAAEPLGIKTIKDLSAAAPSLKLCATAEFEERDDGLKGLKAKYGGFEFQSVKVYDKGLKYEVLRKGDADVAVCFTTDAQLNVGDIQLLEDTDGFWPPYNLVPILGKSIAGDTKIADVLNPITKSFTTEALQALNAKADIDKLEYEAVAKQYLVDNGFIK